MNGLCGRKVTLNGLCGRKVTLNEIQKEADNAAFGGKYKKLYNGKLVTSGLGCISKRGYPKKYNGKLVMIGFGDMYKKIKKHIRRSIMGNGNMSKFGSKYV